MIGAGIYMMIIAWAMASLFIASRPGPLDRFEKVVVALFLAGVAMVLVGLSSEMHR